MPFPIVWGIPSDTPKEDLLALRRAIVTSLSSSMHIPKDSIHPLFPSDLLGEAETENDGSKTIYVRLDTAMFHPLNRDTGLHAARALRWLGWKIFEAFNGKYEVECFLGDLNPECKVLISPWPE